LNGGSGTAAPQTVASGERATRPLNPSRTNWNFNGWWTAETGGREWDFANDPVAANIILWARWAATCDINGAINTNQQWNNNNVLPHTQNVLHNVTGTGGTITWTGIGTPTGISINTNSNGVAQITAGANTEAGNNRFTIRATISCTRNPQYIQESVAINVTRPPAATCNRRVWNAQDAAGWQYWAGGVELCYRPNGAAGPWTHWRSVAGRAEQANPPSSTNPGYTSQGACPASP
jgi:hypothetical protein